MGEALDFDSIGEETAVDLEKERDERGMTLMYDLEAIKPKFADYRFEAARIWHDAKFLTVTDQESLNIAVMLGGNAKKIGKAIEAERKRIILEPAEFVKGVNGICKMITDSLDEAEVTVKEKIRIHNTRVELERREAERKAREATEALQRKLQAEADEANRKAQAEARARVEEEQRIKREKEAAEARERGAKAAELKALAEKAEKERLEAVRKAEEEAKKIEVIAPTVVAPVVQEAARVTRTESGSASQRRVWTYEVLSEAAVPREFFSLNEQKIRDAIKMGTRAISGVRIFEETKTVFRT
jgi:hypothetical protein